MNRVECLLLAIEALKHDRQLLTGRMKRTQASLEYRLQTNGKDVDIVRGTLEAQTNRLNRLDETIQELQAIVKETEK